MFRYEIKKCTKNTAFKSIWFLLCLFAIIMIFLDAKDYQKYLLIEDNFEYLEVLEDYDTYQEQITSQLESNQLMLGGSLFQTSNQYLNEYVTNYENYYNKLIDYSFEYVENLAYSMILTNHIPIYITFIFIVYMAAYLFLKEKENKISDVLCSYPRYLQKHQYHKLLAILILSIGTFLFLEAVKFMIALRMLDISSFQGYIQGVKEYLYCPFSWMIGTTIFVQFILVIGILVVSSVVISALVNRVNKSILFYMSVTLFVIMEFLFYFYIPNDSVYIFFKVINIVTILDISNLFTNYYCFNLFNHCILYYQAICVFLGIVFLLSGCLLTRKSAVNKQTKHKIMKIKIKNSMLSFYEIKKAMIIKKGFLVLLLIIIYQGYAITHYEVYQNLEDYYVQLFSLDLQGDIGESQENYFLETEEYYQSLVNNMMELDELYQNGELDLATYYSSYEASKLKLESKAYYEDVKESYEYAVSEGKTQFIYEQGYVEAFLEKDVLIQNIVLMLIPLSLIIGMYATYDNRIKMNNLIMLYETKKDRVKNIQRNICILISVFLYHLIFVINSFQILNYFQATQYSFLVTNLLCFNLPVSISIATLLFILYGLGIMLSMLVAMLFYWIAKKYRNPINAIFILLMMVVLVILFIWIL
ncbi:hypothetical protein [Tannockella kyphosi]|uniref:hypothetical protein n=1 Tax=Tannockella kyphosi TaxID=2899121 RepID=UPI0020138FEA|nr:hypothetical protein [Tannockella kyphosi]